MPEKESSVRWFVGIVVALFAAGGGIVALLNYFSSPTIERFDASPHQVSTGGVATLAWRIRATSGGVSAEIKPEVGVVGLAGTRDVRPSSTTSYRLVARSRWGKAVQAEQEVVVASLQRDESSAAITARAIVVLHNNSGKMIVHVKFGNEKWGGWSGEQLSQGIPDKGTYKWPPLQAGAGVYDLMAMDGDGRVLDQRIGVYIQGTYDWRVGGGR